MIEYWHVILVFAGAAGNVILLFMYIRWFRNTGLSRLWGAARQLSPFYKALAVICFLPIVSPAYWISVSPLFWDIIRPFLPPLYHGTVIGMWFVFFVCFSVVLCILCVVAASWLPSESGKKISLFVSSLFTLTSISSLWSLYSDLIVAIGDPHYYWISYLLYMLANVSIAITNTLSIYLIAAKRVDGKPLVQNR